jgi:hypothetical protein
VRAIRLAYACAEDHHLARIAPETGYIVVNPLEPLDQIQHPDISGCGILFSAYVAQMTIAKQIQTMIDSDNNHVATARKRFAINPRPGAALLSKPAAVAPEHHRSFRINIGTGSPHVQVKAVFVVSFYGSIALGASTSV